MNAKKENTANKKGDSFWDVERSVFKTSKGDIKLPIFYQDFSYTHFLYWIDFDRAVKKLAGTDFKACKFIHGKGAVMLTFFEYRQSEIGPYNEVSLAVVSYPSKNKQPALIMPQLFMDAKKWTMGAYVLNLPVTTEIALAGGREIYNYPKFVTDISCSLKGKKFSGTVMDPDIDRPIFSVDGKIGFLGWGIKLWHAASFISYTMYKGKPNRVLTEVDARYRMNLGFSGRLQVNPESRHSMAQNLLDLGLQGKKPFAAISSEKGRMMLNDGILIE
ncbi:MAG: acetoacetate decarboxylase family protein [Spirochaetes bacterium]|nr:acetoacetate decarboxylase family protein [Spirochaetota bacterium]